MQIYIAVVSALICIPVNLILVALFRNIKPTAKHSIETQPNHFTFGNNNNEDEDEDDDDDEVEEEKKETQENGHTYQMVASFEENETCTVSVLSGETENDGKSEKSSCFKRKKNKKIKKKKEPKYLPQWVLYPAWILNMTVVFGCGFMVIWYGMAFGNKKSLEWLTSVTIGLVSLPFGIFVLNSFSLKIELYLIDNSSNLLDTRHLCDATSQSARHRYVCSTCCQEVGR